MKNPRPGLDWITARVGYQGDDCVLWPFSRCQNGYGSFSAFRKFHYAHRWMCEQTHGPAPSRKHHAAHSCGNQLCVNPRHLSWKTNSENQIDRRTHGTSTKGGTRWKLTPEQVAVIKAANGVLATKKLADLFGVNEVTIRQIHSGRIWRTGQRNPGGFTSDTAKAAREKQQPHASGERHP